MAKGNGYRNQYDHYARVYACSLRTIKGWVLAGRKGNDPPPLDSPQLMPSWYSRHIRPEVPEGVLLAGGVTRSTAPAPAAKQDPAPLPDYEPPPRDESPLEIGEHGMSASMERLRSAEASAFAEYERAKKSGDEGKIALTWKRYATAESQLRQSEKSWMAIAQQRGDLVDRKEVQRILYDLHQPLISRVRSLYGDFCKLAGVTRSDISQEVWENRVNSMFDDLQADWQ